MDALPGLEDLLDRHARFWERGPANRPLLGLLSPAQWTRKPYPIKSGGYLTEPSALRPGDIDIERLLGLDRAQPGLTTGDLLSSVGCIYPQAWMECLLGCPILASDVSVTARPAGMEMPAAVRAFSMASALGSPWLAVMDAVLDRAVAAAGEARPVQQLHLRGVVDMLAAYLGEVGLCLAVHDCPDSLAELADRFTELYVTIAHHVLARRRPWHGGYVTIARHVLARRRPWHGGYVSVWHLYAPGPLLDYQIDASNLFSPRVYEEHFLAYDRQVLAQFPYSVTHLHAVGLHQVDALLTLPEVRAIQINLDRETGVWDKAKMLGCCRRIQESGKSLLLSGELAGAELDEFLAKLDSRGLAICANASSNADVTGGPG